MIFKDVKEIWISEGNVKQIASGNTVLWTSVSKSLFEYTGSYDDPISVQINGVLHDLYTLTSAGMLTLNVDAKFWICGSGAGGASAKSASQGGNAGGGGAGAFCTSGDLPRGKYPVEIGAGGGANQDGFATTLGDYTAEGGKTGTNLGKGGNGGTGGGGAAYRDSSSVRNNTGGTGDQIDKIPFGLSSLGAHCAGGGGGMLSYSNTYRNGGNGGTNGQNGNDSGASPDFGEGGKKGGGDGGGIGTDGGDAEFYGSAGGGGGADTLYPATFGKGGTGYQGVVYIAIPAA